MTNNQKFLRFDELVAEGMNAEDALLQVAKESAEEDTIHELISDLYAQLKSYGYSPQESHKLINKKLANWEDVQALKDTVKIGRTIPVDVIDGWDKMSEKQRSRVLWELGFDTKKYRYVIDVGCLRWQNKIKCGEFVYGSERLDKAYLTATIDGYHIASDEARYHKDLDVLNTMRANKKN